ncbi:aminotransferase class I and II family protein [Burkholderia mallei]|nr:aminotransferase class I and II family protein [Burkholderia mallei]KOS86686.1 aminotransferase class I and II family protein [Burkholderia mallei]KOS88621.1 aminotransferase class I and II family protein [Burkholderia mallei]KOT04265.1 aminotransferase class I and II family protein [Burkholderia mallei]KOT17280.1 aminotransferase class I and II family protein [Burkholderia mallei]
MTYSSYHKKDIEGRPLHPETQMMSYGFDPFLSEGAVKPPVFLTSTFAFRSAEDGADFFDIVSGRKPLPQGEAAGLVYSRFNHPNLEIVEDRLALLDGSEAAVVTSSGMSAISAIFLAFLRPGDQLVQSVPLYGGTETLIAKYFREWGVGAHSIDNGLSPQAIGAALEAAAQQGPVRLCYVETPANPTNALIDLDGMRRELDAFEARHGYRPISVCDNTLLGPIFQKPSEHGVDMSVYSLTKYVGGHSDLVGGRRDGAAGSRREGPRGAQRIRLAARSAFVVDADPFDGNGRAADEAGGAHRVGGREVARDESASEGRRVPPGADRRRCVSGRVQAAMHGRRLDVRVRAERRPRGSIPLHQRVASVQVRGESRRHRIVDLPSGVDDALRRAGGGAQGGGRVGRVDSRVDRARARGGPDRRSRSRVSPVRPRDGRLTQRRRRVTDRSARLRRCA